MTQNNVEIASTNYRWIILILFSSFSLTNSYQWIQYSIIPNEIMEFYQISETQLDWFSVIFMLVYIPLFIPATFSIDHYGLRSTLILGTFGNALGAVIKYLAALPDFCPKFWLAFSGQFIAAVSQLYVLTIPPILAGTWFPSRQVSLATSLGVVANQLGAAVGFLVPAAFSDDLESLFLIGMITCILVFVFTFLFLRNEPKFPPSQGQLERRIKSQTNNLESNSLTVKQHVNSCINISKSKNNLLLILSYGLNTGVYYSIATLLGKFVLHFDFAAGNENWIGFTMIVAGILGAFLAGAWLDRTKKYLKTTNFMIFCSLLSLICYTAQPYLYKQDGKMFFLTSFLTGFFMTGYLPVGFELGVELTYPENEATVTGFLNASAQFFGVLLTLGLGEIMSLAGENSVLYANLVACVVIGLAACLSLMIREKLNRTEINFKNILEELPK